MSDEKRLIKRLLTNYDDVGVVGRPVLNHSQMIRVKYGLSLIQILDLNEKDQVLTTNVWSKYVSRRILIAFLRYDEAVASSAVNAIVYRGRMGDFGAG